MYLAWLLVLGKHDCVDLQILNTLGISQAIPLVLHDGTVTLEAGEMKETDASIWFRAINAPLVLRT